MHDRFDVTELGDIEGSIGQTAVLVQIFQSIHGGIDDRLLFQFFHSLGDRLPIDPFISHSDCFFHQQSLSAGTGQCIDDIDSFIIHHVGNCLGGLVVTGKSGR